MKILMAIKRDNMSFKIYFRYLFFILIGFCITSCQEERDVQEFTELKFYGVLTEDKTISTRDVVINNVTKEKFDTPFYIRMETDNEVNCGIYEIPSGYEGRLTSKSGVSLNWLNTTTDHTFYSWTLPWEEEDYLYDNLLVTRSPVSFLPQDYLGQNCDILEKFIGVKEGPFNYRSNGEYVNLQYHHLVSKIVLDQITLITDKGETINDVRGSIKFIGLPQSGIFDRRPRNGKDSPEIILDEDYDTDVTFTFSNQQNSRIFYVFPGMDISSLSFQIDLTTPQTYDGSFFGNFSSVNFKRPQDDEWHKDKSPTTLYAGEVMHMSITLSQGKVTGISLSIDDWNTQDRSTGTTHDRNGVYSNKDLSEILSNNYSKEELKEIFGEEEDDRIIFRQYNDLDHSSSSLLVFDEGTLDGMGHTVSMKSNNNNVTLKNVRDIYITDGTNTIYIDPDGYVWRQDKESGKFYITETKLEPDKQYRISLIDGSTSRIQ